MLFVDSSNEAVCVFVVGKKTEAEVLFRLHKPKRQDGMKANSVGYFYDTETIGVASPGGSLLLSYTI